MTGRMREFQHVAANELPVLYDDFDLPAETREILDGHVKELENWMSGILTWHQDCHRYREEELRVLPGTSGRSLPSPGTLGPTGLGTSSLRPTPPHTDRPDTPTRPEPPAALGVLRGPTGLGTSAARFPVAAARRG